MAKDEEYLKAMEAQRLAFEAQFGSLESMGFEDKTKNVVSESESEEQEEEESNTDDLESDEEDLIYGKGSDDESSNEEEVDEPKEPTVIKFVDSSINSYQPASKAELKMLKSGKAYKAPKPIELTKKQKNEIKNDTEENIKNDLELNRFLQESHILANFNNEKSGADLTLRTMDNTTGDSAIGKARRYTVNSRLKEISSINGKDSVINKLEKTPMAIRKQMVKKYQNKISKFEKDAKEGGIILSKVKKGEFRKIDGHLTVMERIGKGIKSKQKDLFRKKGLKINSVGKNTRNGLVISQKEIDKVNGKDRNFAKTKKGRGGKR